MSELDPEVEGDVTGIRLSNVSNGFPKSQPKSLNLVLNGFLEGVELLSTFKGEDECAALSKTIKYGKNLTKNEANAILKSSCCCRRNRIRFFLSSKFHTKMAVKQMNSERTSKFNKKMATSYSQGK